MRAVVVLAVILPCALLLQGCVAAVPLVAAGAIAKKRANKKEEAKKQEEQSTAQAPEADASGIAKPTWTKKAAALEPAPTPVKTALIDPPPPTETAIVSAEPAAQIVPGTLPMPSPVISKSSYAAFAAYALKQAARAKAGEAVSSEVPVRLFDANKPEFLDCGLRPPAVSIDADDSAGRWPTLTKNTPEPALGTTLGKLRDEGIAIIWLTDRTTAQEDRVRIELAQVGLDPDQADVVLARANSGDSKQERRLVAAQRYCIVAIAGDSKGEIEQAYDFLKDPETPLVVDSKWSAGWFLVPPPLRLAATSPLTQKDSDALDP